ncbi:MAG: plastocyanin/azurin family copper-binding protein [Planctomycetota bacterium]
MSPSTRLLSLSFALSCVTSSADAAIVVVTQSGFGFSPQDITIQVGDTVRWQWTGGIHTVTEGTDGTIDGNEAFHSPLTNGTQVFDVVFDTAFLAANPKPCNFYDYFCQNHFASNMKGTITVLGAEPGAGFCFGDGSLATACPCVPPNTVPSPSGAPGHGCANAFDLDGARMCVGGATSPDTIVFNVRVGPSYAGFGFLVKGNAQDTNGIAGGDGVRCASGQLIRFGGHNAGTNGAPVGSWTYPNSAQTTPVSVATLQTPGQQAFYQLFYRHAAPNFCNAGTTNFSNGYALSWP